MVGRLAILLLIFAGCGGAAGTSGDDDDSDGAGPPPPVPDGGPVNPDPNPIPPPPGPPGSGITTCTPPLALADTSGATVIGDGMPASCTEAALAPALAAGGKIRFNCGAATHVIKLTRQLTVAIGKDTVIDGEGRIALDGDGKTRILYFNVNGNYEAVTPTLTVQRLFFLNAVSTAPANTRDLDGGGAAIHRHGGSLAVIDSTFLNNKGPVTGQDVSGGAIFSLGLGTTTISGARIEGNAASNGGGIGNLGNPLTLVNSLVRGNQATGNGGNPGNGGNGGGVVLDGDDSAPHPLPVTICGTIIADNSSGSGHGGGLFRTSYHGALTDISQSVIAGNRIADATPSMAGGLYLQGTRARIASSAVLSNTANGVGGIFVAAHGPQPGILEMTNTTVADNTARKSLGGGVKIDSGTPGVSGFIRYSTIAGNRAPNPLAFAAGFDGASAVRLESSIVNNWEVGNGWNPINCTQKFSAAGVNLQFPIQRGGNDGMGAGNPGTDLAPNGGGSGGRCADGVVTMDPLLAPLAGGVMVPGAGSPARGAGTSCPPTDQLGRARPATGCAIGAAEP